MLKVIISILLSVLMITTSLREVISVTTFQVSKAYVTKNLCVDKSKVINTCQGKCFLSKLFNVNNSNEDHCPVVDNMEKPSYYYLAVNDSLNLNQGVASLNQVNRLDNLFYLSAHLDQIFHPPQSVHA